MTESQQKPNAQNQKQSIPRDARMVLVVLVAVTTIMILNETLLNVALPSIMSDFGVPASTVQWLSTGFMLTMAVVIPTTGFILERFSTRTVFFASILAFLLGTVVAALAPHFSLLLLGRILQASGTALAIPLLMTTAMTVVPASRRGEVMGIISIVISVAPALGPTVSGVILQYFTWHYLFWFMVPLVLLVGIVGALLVSNIGQRRDVPLDLLSVLLSAFGFGALVFALSSISAALDGDVLVPIIGVASLGALWLFVRRQISLAKDDKALLDVRAFSVRSFSWSIVTILFLFGLFLGLMAVIPIYLQTALLVAPVVSGLVVMPGGLAQGLAAPFVGRLFDKVGPRPLLIPGAIIVALGVLGMAALAWFQPWEGEEVFGQPASAIVVSVLFVFLAIGLGLAMTPLMTTALGSLPAHLYSHGSAILNTLQQLAGAAGTAVLITALTQGTKMAQAGGSSVQEATGFGAGMAFGLGIVLALIACACSPMVRPESPQAVKV